MIKIKGLWTKITKYSVLWIVIPIFILVIIPTLWYTKPLLNLTSSDIKIYQLAITVLGVTVGVGTVVNSTRSASSAAESVRVTKEKEMREQSPHLIALSESIEVPLTIPMYKKTSEDIGLEFNSNWIILYDKDFFKQIPELEENKKIHQLTDEELSNFREYHNEVESFNRYLSKLNEKRVGYRETEHSISILNSGKGTAVNIECEFIFTNLDAFIDYKFSAEHENPSFPNIPRYSIEVTRELNDPMLRVVNLNIEQEISKISPLYGQNEGYYPFQNTETSNFNAIPTGEIKLFPIPTSFMLLVKHYIICEYYKQKYTFPLNFLNEIIDVYRKEDAILPEAKIIIRYTDDELTRTKAEKKDKIDLIYDLSLKENKLNFKDDIISNIYLEAKYVGGKSS